MKKNSKVSENNFSFFIQALACFPSYPSSHLFWLYTLGALYRNFGAVYAAIWLDEINFHRWFPLPKSVHFTNQGWPLLWAYMTHWLRHYNRAFQVLNVGPVPFLSSDFTWTPETCAGDKVSARACAGSFILRCAAVSIFGARLKSLGFWILLILFQFWSQWSWPPQEECWLKVGWMTRSARNPDDSGWPKNPTLVILRRLIVLLAVKSGQIIIAGLEVQKSLPKLRIMQNQHRASRHPALTKCHCKAIVSRGRCGRKPGCHIDQPMKTLS